MPGISSGTFTFNSDDEMASETYDSNGNALTMSGKVFTYDSENHLKSMNGGAVALVYDGDGHRVAKTVNGVTTRYLVDDLNPTGYAQVVEEVVGGAVQREYAYGSQRISQSQFISNTWTTSYYSYDGFGSVRQLTNAAGAVTDSYEYDAFGNSFTISGTTPNNYMYRGEQWDADLGLYYLRARYYNPLTGRFLSRDPENGRRINPKTLQKYLYASGDPVNLLDPTGRATYVKPTLGGAVAEYVGIVAAIPLRVFVVTQIVIPAYLETPQGRAVVLLGLTGAALGIDIACSYLEDTAKFANLVATGAETGPIPVPDCNSQPDAGDGPGKGQTPESVAP